MLPGAPRRGPHNDKGLMTWNSKCIHADKCTDTQFLVSTVAEQRSQAGCPRRISEAIARQPSIYSRLELT